MDDLISRQAAIDALKGLPTWWADEGGYYGGAQPPWILCSKKMPDEHEWLGTKKFGTTISDEVYVTFENEKGERFCKHMTFQNGELGRYDKAFIEAWYKGSKPIAWMPLPEPYREERTEE